MRQHFYKLALIVVLGSGFAIAQSYPQQQPSSPQQPSTSSPSSTDQQQPSTAPDQGKTLPNTDQTAPKDQNAPDQNKDNSKMPQSDAAPAAAANGDVQNNIQSAIQKDPTLASANVTVDVKNGKSVELMGTVPSKEAKDTAERIAKENSGGLKVKNHLKVAGASDTAQPKSDKDMSNPKL